MIRLVSYLSPGLPRGLFEAIADMLGGAGARVVEVDFVEHVSGPEPGGWPGGADLGFMCAPAYVALRRAGEATLVPAAPVFSDPRASGRPVYFSDVVVRATAAATTIDDLRGARWAVNDPRSLSGYRCVADELSSTADMVWSGGHLKSLEMVRSGEVDAAAIDANVLAHVSSAGLRVVHTFGPHPVQPLVARSGSIGVDRLAGLLLGRSLPQWGVRGFAVTSDERYPDSLA